MNGRMRMDKRGISPVVATVILVAVTIVVAVAVAYWMGGITGLYTRFEKIEIVSASAEFSETDGWTITIGIKNTGSADATIDNVLLNGKQFKNYGNVSVEGDTTTLDPDSGQGISIKIGQSLDLTIVIPADEGNPDWPFQHGVSVEIRLHSASGQDYPKTITLP